MKVPGIFFISLYIISSGTLTFPRPIMTRTFSMQHYTLIKIGGIIYQENCIELSDLKTGEMLTFMYPE